MHEGELPRRERRRLARVWRRMLRVSAAAATLFPALVAGPVRAEEYLSPMDRKLSLGAGIFAGYRFGAGERAGFEWGIEAFATQRVTGLGCTADPRAGLGPLLQLAVRETSDPRLTLAVQGGGELARSWLALTGELGVTYRFGSAPGFDLHLGVVPEIFLANAGFRYQVVQDEPSVTGGVRIWPTYGEPSNCAVGRPLRAAVCREASTTAWLASKHAAGASARELAARSYASDAQLECASVPAFLQLACELLAHSAPATLAERALDAACDEIRHARQCAALAARWLGREVKPSLPVFEPRPLLHGLPGLARLARESWSDGCLSEGLAAQQAALASRFARDPDAQRLQSAIAGDEARHAELAWSILDYCVRAGGEPVRTAVSEEAAVHTSTGAPPPEGLEAYGRLGPRALAELAKRNREGSQRRLHAMLHANA